MNLGLHVQTIFADSDLSRKALSTLATIVAEFGDNLSPKPATVAGIRRL